MAFPDLPVPDLAGFTTTTSTRARPADGPTDGTSQLFMMTMQLHAAAAAAAATDGAAELDMDALLLSSPAVIATDHSGGNDDPLAALSDMATEWGSPAQPPQLRDRGYSGHSGYSGSSDEDDCRVPMSVSPAPPGAGAGGLSPGGFGLELDPTHTSLHALLDGDLGLHAMPPKKITAAKPGCGVSASSSVALQHAKAAAAKAGRGKCSKKKRVKVDYRGSLTDPADAKLLRLFSVDDLLADTDEWKRLLEAHDLTPTELKRAKQLRRREKSKSYAKLDRRKAAERKRQASTVQIELAGLIDTLRAENDALVRRVRELEGMLGTDRGELRA